MGGSGVFQVGQGGDMGLSRGSQGAPGRIVGGSGMSWGLWAAPGGPWGGLGLHPPPAGSLMPRPPCSCAVMTEFARLQLQPKGIRGRYHPRVPVPWASHPPDSALPRVPPSFPVVLPGEEKTDTGGPQTPENDNGDGDTVPAPDGPEAPRTAKPGEVCEVLGGGWVGGCCRDRELPCPFCSRSGSLPHRPPPEHLSAAPSPRREGCGSWRRWQPQGFAPSASPRRCRGCGPWWPTTSQPGRWS